ncbi:MAG: leucine-rich repeat protein [Clostridiales bacterium]|nr:leucine-rich repeat protein [Clostridiales bacterium]
MKKQRKIIHLYLLILGLFIVIGYSTVSKAATSAEDFTYKQSGNVVSITKYNGLSSVVNVGEAFPDAEEISIESYAFSLNTSITQVILPETVVSIGEAAFKSCSNLQTVSFSAETKSLVFGKSVFEKCTSLVGLAIPDCVNVVPERLCYNCSSLGSVTLPERCTSIGNEAFMNCGALKNIHIPGNCTSIGEKAFTRCSVLSSVVFEETTEENRTFTLGGSAFSSCSMLTSISLPKGCTNVPANAFWCCKGLKSIMIPDECTGIQAGAFYACYALSQINSDSNQNAILPKECKTVGNEAFRECTSLKNVEIPSACASVGDNTFDDCTGLNAVTFINPDTSIGTEAFPTLDSAPNFVIYCNQIGSVTIYAQSNGINYKTGVQSIKLTKLPTVTEYMYSTNGSLDLTGMEVKAQVLSETSDVGFVYEDVEISECAISGFDSTKPGIQTITVAYAGGYTSFEIKVYCNLEKTTVTVDPATYTGENVKPSFVVFGNETGQGLRPETDYICTYQNNKNAGTEASITLKGTGFYKGEKTVSFTISPKSLEDNNTVITVEDMTYTGKQLCPVPVVTCDGKQLTTDKEYVVTYGTNTDVGKGLVSVEGIGNYKGSVKKWFNINASSLSGENNDGNTTSGDNTPPSDTGTNDSGSTNNTTVQTNIRKKKPKKGKTYACDNMYYKVTGSSTVTFTKPVKKNVKEIVIPDEVMINGWSFKVTKINKKACYKNKYITSVIVGDNVTHVGDMAFAYCKKLNYVSFGTSVTSIGAKAMYNDTKLNKVVIKSKKLKKVGRYAFKGISKNKKANIISPNKKTEEIYKKKIKDANK